VQPLFRSSLKEHESGNDLPQYAADIPASVSNTFTALNVASSETTLLAIMIPIATLLMILVAHVKDQLTMGLPQNVNLSIHSQGRTPVGFASSLKTRSSVSLASSTSMSSKLPWVLPRSRPYIIAHRGASGVLPEHTLEGYQRAIDDGADFIECDMVLTRDLVPICRHEPNLSESTDAPQKFPSKARTYLIDGKNETGIFAHDLTWAEVQTLRAKQPWPFRDQQYNGKFMIPRMDEYLDVALNAKRTVGVYIETKHPTFFNQLPMVVAANTSVEDLLLGALRARGYDLKAQLNSPSWLERPVLIQSFEQVSLKRLHAASCLPLILLTAGWPGYVAADTGKTHAQMVSDASLAEVASYAVGVGPWKESLVVWEAAKVVGAAAGKAAGKSAAAGAYKSTGLLERLHAHGLQVHPYTFRNEARFVLDHLGGDPNREYEALMGPGQACLFPQELRGGVNAVFTDFTSTAWNYIEGQAAKGAVWNMTLVNAPATKPCVVA